MWLWMISEREQRELAGKIYCIQMSALAVKNFKDYMSTVAKEENCVLERPHL